MSWINDGGTDAIEAGLSALGAELEKEKTTSASKEELTDLDAFMARTVRHERPFMALITGRYEVEDDNIDVDGLVFSVRSLNAMTDRGSIVVYGEHSEMIYNRTQGKKGSFALLEKDLMTGSYHVKRAREIRGFFPSEVIFDIGMKQQGQLSREQVENISIFVDRILVFEDLGIASSTTAAFALPDWAL